MHDLEQRAALDELEDDAGRRLEHPVAAHDARVIDRRHLAHLPPRTHYIQPNRPPWDRASAAGTPGRICASSLTACMIHGHDCHGPAPTHLELKLDQGLGVHHTPVHLVLFDGHRVRLVRPGVHVPHGPAADLAPARPRAAQRRADPRTEPTAPRRSPDRHLALVDSRGRLLQPRRS